MYNEKYSPKLLSLLLGYQQHSFKDIVELAPIHRTCNYKFNLIQ